MDRYEEALEKARTEYEKARKQGYTWLMDLLEGMFPEMKESEDEGIRRHLIDIVETYWGTTNDPGKAADLAWLERQKESTWTEEDESFRKHSLPRILNPKGWTMEQIEADRKRLKQFVERQKNKWIEKKEEHTEELPIRLNGVMQEYVKAGKDEEEQEYRLKCYQLFWDALGDSEFFKQKEQKFTEKQDYSDLTDLERAIHRGFLVVGVENVPVTIIKETAQDCLAQMKQQKGANGNEKEISNGLKPAGWSEDIPDEYYNGELSTFEGLLYTVISMFVSEYEKDKNTNLIRFVKESSIDLLKTAKKGKNLITWMGIDKDSAISTLKQTAECLNSKNLWPGLQSSLLDLAKDLDAMRSQSMEWNEEDEENRQIINEIVWESIGKNIESIEDGFVVTQGTATKLIKWLNSLPESFSLQPQQEWSEEDEKHIEALILASDRCMGKWHCCNEQCEISEHLDWLKSLRPPQYCENCKLKRSVENWKPSEEQMNALMVTLEYMPDTFKPRCTLITLQNDLKKLM